ncbi:LD-carboxypeptidase [Tenacibaculum sp. SG-28]|nr:LD-carboxypeptidase [Tenacibaculum sp. SG-28]
MFINMHAQHSSMKLKTPTYLQEGDTIAIVAPAGILKNRKAVIDTARQLAESWGLIVVYGKNVFRQDHHFAGSDAERAADFQEALDNPSIKAIWCARGGYGSVRIIDKLDFSKFLEQPKWIIGYSDVTVFHNHIHNLGVETLHAMMATSMQDKPAHIERTISSLRNTLFGEELRYSIPANPNNVNGEVTGQLVGGNIAILASMLGSKSQIHTENKILFIEEIGEYKYAIDRMLQSLKRAGYFSNVKGVVVGGMTKIKKNSTPWGSSIEQLIKDILPEGLPVMFHFPAGHDSDNRALLFGREARMVINADTASLTFSE